jgi:hypothetical protein
MASNTDFRMNNGLAKGLLVAATGFLPSFPFASVTPEWRHYMPAVSSAVFVIHASFPVAVPDLRNASANHTARCVLV